MAQVIDTDAKTLLRFPLKPNMTGRGRASKPAKAPVVSKPRARVTPTSPVKVFFLYGQVVYVHYKG